MDEEEKGTSASSEAEPEVEVSSEAVVGEVEPVEATPPLIPDILPVLPLRGLVVYPYAALPLMVGQARSVQLVDDAMRGNRLVALAAQIDPGVENANPIRSDESARRRVFSSCCADPMAG